MFDLDDIREEQSGTLTVENPKGDIVIEFHTYATKQWNRAVKRYKPDLKTFIDPESGMFAIVSFQPKELKEALASLVISMKQGSDEETDSKKIKELFLDPTLGVFPTLLQRKLNTLGNEDEEDEQNNKQSSGSDSKAGEAPTKNTK